MATTDFQSQTEALTTTSNVTAGEADASKATSAEAIVETTVVPATTAEEAVVSQTTNSETTAQAVVPETTAQTEQKTYKYTEKHPEISAEEFEKLVGEFPFESFEAPDGKTLYKKDAVYAYANRLVFDVGYVRQTSGIFSSTFTEPDLFDFKSDSFKDGLIADVETEYISVRAGDRLANGLDVESAFIEVYPIGSASTKRVTLGNNTIATSGELTLDGVLYCLTEDSVYIFDQGDMLFFTESCQSGAIIDPCGELQNETKMLNLSKYYDGKENFAIYFDGTQLRLGNIYDNDSINESFFKKSPYVSAEIIIENPTYSYSDSIGGLKIKAELVSAEKLK